MSWPITNTPETSPLSSYSATICILWLVTWPPYAPVEPAEDPRFLLDEWAPPSTVRHPWLRVGRWTLLYRRAA